MFRIPLSVFLRALCGLLFHPLTLPQRRLGFGEVGRAEFGVDFHGTTGVGQGLGGFALTHEGLSEAAAVLGDQFLTAHLFRQGEGLAGQSLGPRPVFPVQRQLGQIARVDGHTFCVINRASDP